MRILGAPGACLVFVVVACSKTSEPAGGERDNPTAADARGTVPSAQKTDGGDKGPVRDPDWTFDTDDPGRDYVGRYLRATMRYGGDTACVVLGPSSSRNGDSVVEVRNPVDGACGKAGILRDTFVVNVANDRLRLDEPNPRAPLRAWPDASLPDGPPNAVLDIQNLTKWRAPLHDALERQSLFPLRVQLYGRGTYPVISLAGWHALFDPKGEVNALRDPAKDLCSANNGAPLAVIGGMDRSLVLRIDCPDRPHWEHL